MPGVLTLGEDFVDAQNQIDEKRAEQEKLRIQHEKDKLTLDNLQISKDVLKSRFVDNCWESKGNDYKKTFGGSGDFSRKELFAYRVKRTSPIQHSLVDLKSRYQIATDVSARKYAPLDSLDISKLDSAEIFPLLGEPIISTADSSFSRFMQSLEATAWVKDGHEHYAPKTDGKCPYCQQALPSDLAAQIAECFDGKYSDDCAKLAAYQKRYAEYTAEFVILSKRHIETLKTMPQGFGRIGEYEKNVALLEKTIAENIARITAKIAKPSDSVAVESISLYLEALNALIA
jgi:wobble nucleotide-excising tRNase